MKGGLLILGDFNFHVNNTNCVDTQQFTTLLESFNLQQHVTVPTRYLGNTIDLLLTRSSDCGVHITSIQDHLISDHFII